MKIKPMSMRSVQHCGSLARPWAVLMLGGLLLTGLSCSAHAQEPAWTQIDVEPAQTQASSLPVWIAQAPAPAASPASSAAQASGVGQVTHLSGTLMAKRADGTVKLLSVKSEVEEGDTLATQDGTYARVKFADGAEVVLRPTSQLKVESYRFAQDKPASDNVFLNLLKGGLRTVSGLIGRRNRDHVRVASPSATIGIRGTHFGMLFCQNDCGAIKLPGGAAPPNGLHLDVAVGAITVTNASGTQLVVNAGQYAFAPPPGVVAPPIIVPPSRGIQVTMPPTIARNDTGGRTMGAGRSDDGCAIR